LQAATPDHPTLNGAVKLEGLSVEVTWQDDDVLKLEVRAGNKEFSGAARVYSMHGALREVADILKGFPLGRGDQREFTLGSFEDDSAGGGVLVSLRCESNAGHSFADVRLQSAPNEGTPSAASFTFQVEAGAIDHFVVDLREMDDQRSGSARLPPRGTPR
jgi:hypothetical protein